MKAIIPIPLIVKNTPKRKQVMKTTAIRQQGAKVDLAFWGWAITVWQLRLWPMIVPWAWLISPVDQQMRETWRSLLKISSGAKTLWKRPWGQKMSRLSSYGTLTWSSNEIQQTPAWAASATYTRAWTRRDRGMRARSMFSSLKNDSLSALRKTNATMQNTSIWESLHITR